MTKFPIFFILGFVISFTASSQSAPGQFSMAKAPALNPHYEEEYTTDLSQNPAKWNLETPGMHVSFGSEDKLYFRSEVPELTRKSYWEETSFIRSFRSKLRFRILIFRIMTEVRASGKSFSYF